jgi:hypothetical protein
MKFFLRQILPMAMIAAVASLLFSVPLASPARAAALNPAQVEKFMGTLPDLKALSDEMQQAGKGDALDEAAAPHPGQIGGFEPYTNSLKALKSKFPADYRKLGDLVHQHGFMSQDDWADTGNRVMLAYMALKLEAQPPETLKAMQDLPVGTLNKMPPEARAQFEQSRALMQAAQKVSSADKDAMRPYVAQFDEWANQAAAEQGGQ